MAFSATVTYLKSDHHIQHCDLVITERISKQQIHPKEMMQRSGFYEKVGEEEVIYLRAQGEALNRTVREEHD